MRALRPLVLVLLALSLLSVTACQSRDKRVCEHINELLRAQLESYGQDPGDAKQSLDKCLALKTDSGANEQEWTAYLDCGEKAKAWGDVEACVGELGVAVGKRKVGL
jgi:hypothetical protein